MIRKVSNVHGFHQTTVTKTFTHNNFSGRRTKWKRQNQMQLDQLRQRSSLTAGSLVEKELSLVGSGGTSSPRTSDTAAGLLSTPTCCPSSYFLPTMDRSCFIATAGLFTRLPHYPPPTCPLWPQLVEPLALSVVPSLPPPSPPTID